MIEDAHYHRGGYPAFLAVGGCEYAFRGTHPWEAAAIGGTAADFQGLEAALAEDPALGVGEIGLDRMRTRVTGLEQLAVFRAQLALAARYGRPVVLHGARCWGETVAACEPFAGKIPAFLFHGFSRSAGLLPKIVALNGFVGAGRAVLNDHAVNYRELVKTIPKDRIVAESDMDDAGDEDPARAETVSSVRAKVAELAGVDEAELTANLRRFAAALGA